jgi:Flp pilus assembly protein TadG
MNKRSGAVTIEFALVGIPLIFALISTFEMSRGMWTYHTLAHTVRDTARFIVVRGYGCTSTPQTCAVTVGDVAKHARDAAVGLLPRDMDFTFAVVNDTVECRPLSSCLENTRIWPTFPGNLPGMEVTVTARYPFRSAISMFWPGTGEGMTATPVVLPAQSRATIQF